MFEPKNRFRPKTTPDNHHVAVPQFVSDMDGHVQQKRWGEIRNPKPEIRMNAQIPSPKTERE